jgi:N-acetylmuramoyl-L-alanine amidase
MKRIVSVVVFAFSLGAQTARDAQHSVTAVRHWSQLSVTRVAVEVSGEFVFRTDTLHNPERVYFDILDSRPRLNGKRSYSEDPDDRLLKRIRVAETAPGVTRVVLDLAEGVSAHTSQLVNPNRLIVELSIGNTTPPPSVPEGMPQPRPTKLSPPPVIKPAPPVRADAIETLTGTAEQPAPPVLIAKAVPVKAVPVKAVPVRSEAADTSASLERVAQSTVKAPLAAQTAVLAAPETARSSAAAEIPLGAPKAARHTAAGDTSLVRALGLKIQRVVIDPGHGGHDQGTQGPHGLLEKDLVLDVGLRLGKLIQDGLGAEVVYTRSDDTFIPLEGRTEIANEKKADLFLSIHANSSPVPRITGVETYYLSLTDSKEAKDVAARENDSSQLSVFELRDLIQKITLNDKVEESKEFASRMQAALFAFSAKSFPTEKNRGIKKAPFVVLIGARMPSVLAEIGFVSNTREEALLKKPEYRQKLADALYRGVSRYADSLSHFQVAQNTK